MSKVPKMIHCTFVRAEVDDFDPSATHIAVYAKADQYNVRMIVWPAQVAELIETLQQMTEWSEEQAEGITQQRPWQMINGQELGEPYV